MPSPITRSRQSVEEIASAGTSIKVVRAAGSSAMAGESRSTPGRVTPTKCARSNSWSTSRQVRIWARASAPVMKNSSAPGRIAEMSSTVSTVYVGPGRSMSTRLTQNRGLEAVAITVQERQITGEHETPIRFA